MVNDKWLILYSHPAEVGHGVHPFVRFFRLGRVVSLSFAFFHFTDHVGHAPIAFRHIVWRVGHHQVQHHDVRVQDAVQDPARFHRYLAHHTEKAMGRFGMPLR